MTAPPAPAVLAHVELLRHLLPHWPEPALAAYARHLDTVATRSYTPLTDMCGGSLATYAAGWAGRRAAAVDHITTLAAEQHDNAHAHPLALLRVLMLELDHATADHDGDATDCAPCNATDYTRFGAWPETDAGYDDLYQRLNARNATLHELRARYAPHTTGGTP